MIASGDDALRAANSARASLVHHLTTSYTGRLTIAFVVVSFSCAAIISVESNVPFLDGLYIAVSAVTCTGLVSISVLRLHTPSFVIMAFMMLFCNQMCITSVYPLIGRCWSFHVLLGKMQPSHKKERALKTYAAVKAALLVMVSYILTHVLLGIVLLTGALQMQPNDATLSQRNISRESVASFLSLSGFTQGGFAMTANSVQYLKNNPLAYLLLSFIILAGSELAPVLVLVHIYFLRFLCVSCCGLDPRHLDHLLERGEDFSPFFFPLGKALYLSAAALAIIAAQYVFFLISTVGRDDSLQLYGSGFTLVGLGYFQCVATRFAGFQIINLRHISQGMLVVYAMAMYIVPATALSLGRRSASKARTTHLGLHLRSDDIPPPPPPSISSGHNTQHPPHPAVDSSFLFLPAIYAKARRWGELQLHLDNNHGNWLMLCFFVLSFTEDAHCASQRAPCTYNLYYNLFEVVSAYTNAGVSVGLPGEAYSYSGNFSSAGKVVIIFLMLLGKHRGFPPTNSICMDMSLALFLQTEAALSGDSTSL